MSGLGQAFARSRGMNDLSFRAFAIGGLCLCAALLPGTAAAQKNEHIGLGAGINLYRPSDHEAQRSQGLGIVYRWHTFHSGWGPTLTLDLHKTDFNQRLGSIDAPVGILRMNTLLAGFGRTQNMGRLSTSASVTGGYALNHLSASAGAGAAFESAGLTLNSMRVRNSPAARPEVSVWYDVAKRLGVEFSAAYFVARPELMMDTASGPLTSHLRANSLEMQVGCAVGFLKRR